MAQHLWTLDGLKNEFGLVPSSHMVVYDHLRLQAQGLWYALLTSVRLHTCGIHAYVQTKHLYAQNENK